VLKNRALFYTSRTLCSGFKKHYEAHLISVWAVAPYN